MAILKCKMCGGDLNFEEGVTVVDCEYCGTKQTVPTIDDEKKITLFARANRLRFACEFDKASGVYESIVADFPEEAEAYWGLVLCKYGIEYVDDPATGKKIPTCHRSSFENVMDNENFEQVLENADPIARTVYREEAKQIEELRRGIIEVSNKEEPYDIFICYKETAENGERTIDSVIAQDVYHELTEKGYRVFFSRITLEDKLGQEYEPYIFAALNSAKIMLAFGTDYEYYNAVWVKNEWSRFLQLIAKGEKKTLIPCFKNIDAYDMPKEFARLQAQDMGKVGAMQDLLRGIEKLLPKSKETQAHSGKEPVIVQQTMQSATVDSLLKRVFLYLEDGDWSNAAEYCNRVLDISPENAEAYVGLLMAELQVSKEEELARQTKKGFGQNKHFIKAVRFATEERRKVLEGYNKTAEEQQEKERLWQKEHMEKQQRIADENRRRQEEERRRQEENRRRQEEEQRRQKEEKEKDDIYQKAVGQMNSAQTMDEFRSAAKQFQSISGFQDADALAAQCLEKSENARKDSIYNSAKSALTPKGFALETLENIAVYKAAIKKLESIPGWRDADKLVGIYKQKIEEIIKTEIDEWKQKMSKKYERDRNVMVGVSIYIAIVILIHLYCRAFMPPIKADSITCIIVFVSIGIMLIGITTFVYNRTPIENHKKWQLQFMTKLRHKDKEVDDRLAAMVMAEFRATEKRGIRNSIISLIVLIGIVVLAIKVIKLY